MKSIVKPFAQNYANNGKFLYCFVNHTLPYCVTSKKEFIKLNEDRKLFVEMASRDEEPTPLQIETPTSFMICGPINSGKSWFVKKLLENAHLMFN